MDYKQAITSKSGWTPKETFDPRYLLTISCCDCGLVHEIDAEIESDGKISFSVRVNARATAGRRRGKRFAWIRKALRRNR